MPKPRKMDETELKGLIDAEIRDATGFTGTDLSQQRSENIDYYLGKPLGNEQEGRSSVVSSDVQDTVEWILPQLIRIFTSGDETVAFTPSGPEDIEVAEQATEYVNHIWNSDNEGFLNYYTWFKDALITKNGTVKIWWEEKDEWQRERYEGLTDAQFTELVSPDDVEIVEHTEQALVEPGEFGPLELVMHDVVIKKKAFSGRVKVMPVPPEEFLIERTARDIPNARFVGHRRRRTISSLLEDGFDPKIVNRLPASDSTGFYDNEEEISRDTVEDESERENTNNPAMREVWVTECYIRVDMDGDGIAEMRQVTAAGPGSDILSNEPWEGPTPFASVTPIVMPHRFYGLAIADLIKDLQRIKTAILRQYLDNLYLQNNQKEEVVEDNIVDPGEVLSSVPGQKIRVKEAGSIRPIPVPDVGSPALQGLEYVDKLRENRTGVSERTQGLSSDTLHDTYGGQRMLMSAAQSRVELIARIFAETGVKDAFKQILYWVTARQQQERVIRLRNEWVNMDPRTWSNEMDMQVSVGLGTGDKEQQLMMATRLAELQERAAQVGMVRPEHLYNTAEIIVNAMGFKDVDRFFAGPNEMQQAQQEPPQDPRILEIQMEDARKREEMQADMMLRQYELALKYQSKEAQQRIEAELSVLEISTDAAVKREQNQLNAVTKARDSDIKASVRMGGMVG